MATTRAVVLVGLAVAVACAAAAVCTGPEVASTAAGGPWMEPSTWVGELLPNDTSCVVLAAGATVTVNESVAVEGLSLAAATSTLAGPAAGPAVTVIVAGDVDNAGVIAGAWLKLVVEGDLHNAATGSITCEELQVDASVANDGVVAPALLAIAGAGDRSYTGSKGVGGASVVFLADATFTGSSPVLAGVVNFGMHVVNLASGQSLVLTGPTLSSMGSIVGGPLVLQAPSVAVVADLGAPGITGDVVIAPGTNLTASGPSPRLLTIVGNVTNHGRVHGAMLLLRVTREFDNRPTGVVTNRHLHLGASVFNDGLMSPNELNIVGSAPRTLAGSSPIGSVVSTLFESSVFIENDAIQLAGSVDFNQKTVTIAPGATITLVGPSILGGGAVSGGVLYLRGTSATRTIALTRSLTLEAHVIVPAGSTLAGGSTLSVVGCFESYGTIDELVLVLVNNIAVPSGSEVVRSGLCSCASVDPCVHGVCEDNVSGDYTCNCTLTGFHGLHCETDVDECALLMPCMNGATCFDQFNDYDCLCVPGFTGRNCETDIDECASSPCISGACVNGINEFTCDCAAGWTGTLCETDIDDCASSPCLNNGTCADAVDGYACNCTAGFEGQRCETNIDDCDPEPCANGTCIDGITSFTCLCAPGYDGALCDNDIDECASDPCQHGGTCQDLTARFACDCLDGFTGTVCETQLFPCESDPCQNGGNCTEIGSMFVCDCPTGFTGVVCESNIDDCSPSNNCQIGFCIDGVNEYACHCLPGWDGATCNVTSGACSPNPCQAAGVGGVCQELPGGHSCITGVPTPCTEVACTEPLECVELAAGISCLTASPSPSPSPMPPTTDDAQSSTDEKYKWMGIGIAIGAGAFLVVFFLVLCCKSCCCPERRNSVKRDVSVVNRNLSSRSDYHHDSKRSSRSVESVPMRPIGSDRRTSEA